MVWHRLLLLVAVVCAAHGSGSGSGSSGGSGSNDGNGNRNGGRNDGSSGDGGGSVGLGRALTLVERAIALCPAKGEGYLHKVRCVRLLAYGKVRSLACLHTVRCAA